MTFFSLRSARFAAFASTVALLVAAVPAQAATHDDSEHVTVHFGDLNPGSPKDMKVLYSRLKNATEVVCDDDDSVVDLIEYREVSRCEQHAMESAVAHINTPLLSALYDRHFPQAPLVSRISVVVPRA